MNFLFKKEYLKEKFILDELGFNMKKGIIMHKILDKALQLEQGFSLAPLFQHFEPHSLKTRCMSREEAIRILANAEAYFESMKIKNKGILIDETDLLFNNRRRIR